MEWHKKTTHGWNIPEKIAHSSPQTYQSVHNNVETESYIYSDTLEELTKSTQQQYSDTFISESETHGSEIMETVIEATDNQLLSLFEIAYDKAKMQSHSILGSTTESSDSFSHFSTKLSNESQSSRQYSYSETFESSDSLPPAKEFNKEGDTDMSSYTETFEDESFNHTNSLQRSGYISDISQYSSDRGMQYDEFMEYTRSSYTFLSEERGDDASASYGVECSYSFDPTEEISKLQVVDLETLQKEEALKAKSEAVRKEFTLHAKMAFQQYPKWREILDRKTTQKEGHLNVKQNTQLKNYCKKKIMFLRSQEINGIIQPGDTRKEAPKIELPPLLLNCGVDPAIIERLKLKNIMMCMKNASKMHVHDSGTCKECRKQKEIVDQNEATKLFADSKKHLIQTKLMDEKVEQHLQMNSVSMIADLAKTLPKLSDDPQIIQDKLYATLYGKNYI